MSRSLDQLAAALGSTEEPWQRRALLRGQELRGVDLAGLVERAQARRKDDPRAAVRIAGGAYAVARARGDVGGLRVAGTVLAQSHIVLGQPVRALQRLAGLQRVVSPQEGASVALTIAQTLMLLARFDEAAHVLARARATLPARGAARLRAGIDVIEGQVHSARGEAGTALACFERGRRTLARLGARSAVASIDINRATALTNLEEYERAERLYARGERRLRAHGRPVYALQAAYNHAYLRFMRGYFHDALDRFRDLRPRFERANDRRHLALCDLDEAEISLHLNLPAHASDLAARAASVLGELGLSADVARAEFFGAVAARRLGRVDEARQRLGRAERTFRELGNAMWWGISLHRLAEIDLDSGAPGRAAARAAEAARRLRACGLRERAGYAEVLVASIELRAGEPQAARARMEALLADLDALRLPWLRCEAHHALARAHAQAGHLAAAARHALRATNLLERHRVAVPPDEYMAAFLTGKAELFRDAARIVLDRGGPSAGVRAFELAEQARGRALLDLLRHERPVEVGGRGGALAREAWRLEREIDGLATRMPALDRGARAEDAERRAQEAGRRETRLAACLDRLAARDPAAARLRRGAPPRFREVVRALPVDETLVEYFLAGNEIVTFVVHEGRLDVRRQSLAPGALAGLLGRASFQLDRPNVFDRFDERFAAALTRSARAVLEELHDLLLAPIRAMLRTPRVVFVPHGELSGVPFHALEAGGRPLLLDHEVVQAPSAAVYLHCLAARRPVAHTSLLLGVPDEAAPNIRGEIEALAGRIPRSRAFIGAEATAATLARYGRRAGLIHVAAHARFQPDEPMESGLRLADGWLTIPRIAALRLQPRLIVLAGCGTGRVSVTEGGELFGLVRGFLQAGAAALVTSLWPVPDAQTARFMDAFYGRLLAGAAPASALRGAALDLRAQEAHPFHWAPFVLLGKGA